MEKERDAERARRAAEKWKKGMLSLNSDNAEPGGGKSGPPSPFDNDVFAMLVKSTTLSKKKHRADKRQGRNVSSARRANRESGRRAGDTHEDSVEEHRSYEGGSDEEESTGSSARAKTKNARRKHGRAHGG